MNCKVCGNTSAKNTSVSFFRFPKENTRCKDWAERCNLVNLYEKHGTLQFYKSFRICSEHFEPSHVVFDGRKKRLLQSAVPQIFCKREETNVSETHNSNNEEIIKLKLVENLCRLCAEENRNLTDIFGWRGKTLNLEGKLKYFPLVMNKCDVLPLRVCYQCISKVNEFYDFITNCIKAETKLRIMLDQEDCDTTYKMIEPDEYDINMSQGNKIQNLDDSADITTYLEEPDINVTGQSFEQSPPGLYLSEVEIKDEENDFVAEQPPNNFKTNKCFQITNDTKFIKEVDFSRNISFQHDYSNMILRDQSSLEQNIKTEHQDQSFCNETKYACDICLKRFTNIHILNTHLESHSSKLNGNEKFVCKTCKKLFTNRYYLKKHIVTHSRNNSNKCQMCGKTFHKVAFLKQLSRKSDSSLTSHLRPSQSVLEAKTCKTCLEYFPDLDKYNQHKQSLFCRLSKRKNSKSAQTECRCQFCDKLFKNWKICLEHESKHTGDTPYQCKQCGKTFRSKPSLRQHRSVHSDERLFSCQECGMSFKRKDTLCNHLRIHTGERPFVCKICGFAFKQRGDCIKHEKNHDRECEGTNEQTRLPEGGISLKEESFTNVSQAPEGVTWNENKHSTLPLYEEIMSIDALEETVAGRMVSLEIRL